MDSPTAPDLLAGRYRLGTIVGRGGMAEVVAADDIRLGRAVAVKMLRAELAADPLLRRRFEDEARAAARINHPHVVAIFDTGEHDGVPYIVMERLPGRSLADELRAGPATIERACIVAGQVLSGLEAAHGAGVVHRDIKPANVLIAKHDEVKVADFGIATIGERAALTSAGMVVGTASYLAPERIAGSPATAASDVYSVGVMLYEMLAGRVPFQGDTPLAVLDAIQQGRRQPLREVRPGVDPQIAAMVERAMHRDPDARFASARAMADALPMPTARRDEPTLVRSAASPGPVSATRVLSVSPPRRGNTLRRTPRAFVASIAAGLATIVVAAAITLARHDSTPAGGTSDPTTVQPPTSSTTTTTTQQPTNVTPNKHPRKGDHGD